jgi:phage terminase large subunit-like protein
MESKKKKDAAKKRTMKKILVALERGVPFKWACEANGITENNGFLWRYNDKVFDRAVREARGSKVCGYYERLREAADNGEGWALKFIIDKADSALDRTEDTAQRAEAVDPAIAEDKAAIGRLGLAEFCKRGWPEIDSAALVWSWHLDEICGELEAAIRARLERGEPADLAIATPPGSGKSRPASILAQPWSWTIWPWATWITSAYDDDLAARFSRLSKMLVRSPWYQARWPMRVTKDSDHYWENEHGGRRIAAGIGSRITGEHAHIILGDDLVKEQLARIGTPAAIAQAVGKSTDYWFGTLSTRAIDHKAARVIIQQRLHREDPIGVAVDRFKYRSVVFRARFDPLHPDPMTHHQHQREPGELLYPRLTEEALAKVEFELGPTAAAAQLQQEPAPPGGALLKATYMERRWDNLPGEIQSAINTGRPVPGQTWISAWDLAFKGKASSDWTVGQVWCAVRGERWLIDQVRGRWGFREARAQLVALAARYPVIGVHLLEDAANAAATADDLVGAVPGVVLEPVGGGCLARTQAVEGVWASGCVVIPVATWATGPGGFVDEHTRYVGDGTETDDQVSASSLALLYLKSRGELPAWATAAQAIQRGQRNG